MKIMPAKKIRGTVQVPSDKSISHRSMILTGFARTQSRITNILESDDVKSTFQAMKKLGVGFFGDFKDLKVKPCEKPSSCDLYCGNSGTTTRLLAGLVSPYEGIYSFSGDASLSKRPMERICDPISKMNGTVSWGKKKGFLPFTITGSHLSGIRFENKKKSAQVKSAILLAGLRAEGQTTIIEEVQTRDHTERLLKHMGAKISVNENEIALRACEIKGLSLDIPGDFSSAAFFLTLGICHENAKIDVLKCSINSSRTALIDVMSMMGAKVSLRDKQDNLEPYATISVGSSNLQGITIPERYIPNMIDELPLLALMGSQAHGKTTLRNASELRVKESDRIRVLCTNMKAIGVEITELEDGFEIEGPQKIKGGIADSFNDHRMAMLFAIAGVLSQEGVEIKRPECVSVSFPGFFSLLNEVSS